MPPRLPDDLSLIRPATPQPPNRANVGYRPGLAQEAEIQSAEQNANAFQGVTRLGSNIYEAQSRVDYANAEQQFLGDKLQADQDAINDQDYSTLPQRYQARIKGAVDRAASGIGSAVLRSEFIASTTRLANYGADSVIRMAHQKGVDAGRGSTMDAINAGIDQALTAQDEPTRSAALNSVNARITSAKEAGYFTQTEAAKLMKTVPEQYAQKRAVMMMDADPAAAVTALAPTNIGEDGTPTFTPSNDFRDHLDPAKRMDLFRAAQQRQMVAEQKAEIEAMRADRLQEKAKSQAAEQSANKIVSQLIADPTQVDINAIANDPNMKATQKFELFRMTKNVLAGASEGRDTKTYGPGFYDLYKRIHAPDGDPTKITDPTDLYSHVGPNGDLTVSGVDKLTAEIQGKRTPEGEAESTMKKTFLADAKAQISGRNDGLGIADPKGDDLFLKFLATALPAYDAGRAAGKSPAQLLDPDSSDYIGKDIAKFKRPATQRLKDIKDAMGATPQISDLDLSTPDGLIKAVQSGKVPRETGEAIAIKNGWIRPNGAPTQQTPPVPSAPSPPIAK